MAVIIDGHGLRRFNHIYAGSRPICKPIEQTRCLFAHGTVTLIWGVLAIQVDKRKSFLVGESSISISLLSRRTKGVNLNTNTKIKLK